MALKKVIITGANGQLGRELRRASASFPGFEYVFLSRQDFPLDQPELIDQLFAIHQPAYCINCGAYTAVDKAETEKELAFRINAEAVGKLATACKTHNAKLIHISTDYVFDGGSSTALAEDNATNPINVYGASKLQGELLAFQQNEATIVLRTSWVYSAFGNNFVKTMIRLMKERPSINVIDDQVGSPTWAADLAVTILRILSNEIFTPGIYNYSNEGRISWFEFAVAIKELTTSACEVHPIPTTQYPTPAKRPHYSLLNKAKIKRVYGIEIPDWKTSLVSCLGELNA